jgi:hypothetical protein
VIFSYFRSGLFWRVGPSDEFVEAANLSVLSFLLIEKVKAPLIKQAEKLLPRHRLQVLIYAAIRILEIDAQNLCAADNGWSPAALFNPPPDTLMVPRPVRLGVDFSS